MLPVLFADQDLGSLSPVHSFTVILLSFSEPASFDRVLKVHVSRDGLVARQPWCVLNTVCFDPRQSSLFHAPITSANTTEKRPLLAGNNSVFTLLPCYHSILR